jgi:transposase
LKGQKNYNDAEAIAETALRPNSRIVPEKSQDQRELQACHRVRSLLVSRRTATINQIRAFLIEQGSRQGRPARPPQVTVRHLGEPKGRDLATEDGRHRQAAEIVRKLIERAELKLVIRRGRKTLSVSLYGRLAGILAMATKQKRRSMRATPR